MDQTIVLQKKDKEKPIAGRAGHCLFPLFDAFFHARRITIRGGQRLDFILLRLCFKKNFANFLHVEKPFQYAIWHDDNTIL